MALDYGLEALEASDANPPAVPISLMAQARLAARNGIGIDVVLRRYLAGHTVFGDFVVQEAERLDLRGAKLKRLLQVQAAALDHLLAAASEEHAREAQSSPASADRLHLRLVQSLLDGEPVDYGELRYDLDASHLGLVIVGPGALEDARELGAAFASPLLVVCPESDMVWAWLGGRRPPNAPELIGIAGSGTRRAAIAIGEPADGLSGWRLTHRQAAAALAPSTPSTPPARTG